LIHLGRLLLLFVIGLIAMSLRFLIEGEFDLGQLLTICLFAAGAGLIYIIMRWQYKKDSNYKPTEHARNYTTHLSDRISATKKRMYYDGEYLGSYHRMYDKWWKRVIADIMGPRGVIFLHMKFLMSDGTELVFKEKKGTVMKDIKEWYIYRNNELAGHVDVDFSFKTVRKLKEKFSLTYKGHTYQYQSSKMDSKTEIAINDTPIATGDRLKGTVYELNLDNPCEDAAILFAGFILFNYRFTQ
jgi:hypothetical protein